MIKAIIFDLNGVFLKSELLSERFEEKYQIKEDQFLPALTAIMTVVRKPNAPPAYSLWKPYFDSWNMNLSEADFFDFWFSGEHLDPELLNYAKSLRKSGLKVFILSNNFKERTTYFREKFPELFQNLDGQYFSWETGNVKPDPEAFTNVLNKNDLKAEECIYFDDADKNIESAKSVGIHALRYEGLESAKTSIERLTTTPKG